jgi:hypothetical protein
MWLDGGGSEEQFILACQQVRTFSTVSRGNGRQRKSMIYCAGGYAIYQIENQPQSTGMYMLICIIGMTGAAALYFVATFRGEVNPAYVLITNERAKAAAASAKHPNDTDGAAAPASSGWGFFGARNKEEAVGKAVIAAAPSMGKQLFGSSSSGDPKPAAPQHAFSEAAPTAPVKESKGSMFGGGLFGGGSASKSSKYGYGDDVPEANPFV